MPILGRHIRALALGAACIAAAACHGSSGASPNAATSAMAHDALRDPSSAFWSTRAPRQFLARIETTKGAFVIDVHRDWSPRGADRFYHLVQSGFFDDSRFYRVRAGYIVQFGIAGDPVTAQRWRDARFPDDSVRHGNMRGVVAYAMTGPDTRTTQIYINLRDNVQLDAQGFSPIGVVVRGMDIVDALNAEYGETSGGGMRDGKQGPVFEGGNAYLDRNYPRLDHLVSATVIRAP
ncbi:MAG TPA: peptidylprolyl isomerase [Gemmatimonadaceae bacterium]|nr:peptidylprolyl isomerase [Gemmatimonadaceae bacterium]